MPGQYGSTEGDFFFTHLIINKTRNKTCDAQQLALMLPYNSVPQWLKASGFHKALEKNLLATNQVVYDNLLSLDSASLKLH